MLSTHFYWTNISELYSSTRCTCRPLNTTQIPMRSLRGEVSLHRTNLTPPFILKRLYHARKVSGDVIMCWKYLFYLLLFFLLVFSTVPTVIYNCFSFYHNFYKKYCIVIRNTTGIKYLVLYKLGIVDIKETAITTRLNWISLIQSRTMNISKTRDKILRVLFLRVLPFPPPIKLNAWKWR